MRSTDPSSFNDDKSHGSDLSFKVFHELMSKRVTEILLISSPYDAFIMEEDGRFAERIIHEYRGLNLTRPPRFRWASSAGNALELLSQKKFDLVITMPRLNDMDPFVLGKKIKEKNPGLPIILLAQSDGLHLLPEHQEDRDAIDESFIWSGNTDLLMAMIKSVEDLLNVERDTKKARVRVIVFVEDSPVYRSLLLPALYREIVTQTQSVMEESLNDEDRLLKMRARPKILLADNYETAIELCRQNRPYLLSVFSDVRFLKDGQSDPAAGFKFLEAIKKQSPGLPLLLFSSEEANINQALALEAAFIDKNSPSFIDQIRLFFTRRLGFGDFVFRLPDGSKVGQASNLREMEQAIPTIPDHSIYYHCQNDDFSTWLMARSEVPLASKIAAAKVADFSSIPEIKNYLATCLKDQRRARQKGVISDFAMFDAHSDFVRIGKGSIGGKGRGLAFLATLFNGKKEFRQKFPGIDIAIPQTLFISTEGFDSFIAENNLKSFFTDPPDDAAIIKKCLEADFPKWMEADLTVFLGQITSPLAVRSSSLLEDSQCQPYAGVYNTYMIPNNHPDAKERLRQLIRAIKLVYASTYLEIPKLFSQANACRGEEEKMAVMIQQVAGNLYGDYFSPAISGVAQSHNFYPAFGMKPEDGVAHIAMGLGKTVVEGEAALRFCPKYPQSLPQFSSINSILNISQRYFYAIDMARFPDDFGMPDSASAHSVPAKIEISDFMDVISESNSLKNLFSSYMPDDQRLRDSFVKNGIPVLTFADILKFNAIPLAELISEILAIGCMGMGGSVEIEFAVRFPPEKTPEFSLLQIRPMTIFKENAAVQISEADMASAFCYSTTAMGNGLSNDISDIVYVKSGAFDPARTVEIAAEIGELNHIISKQSRKYLLIGPGRWGSTDRWLGIPVDWKAISGVGSMVETAIDALRVEPSQGTHFFHNMTSFGISYITVKKNETDFFNEAWLDSFPAQTETQFLRHVHTETPLTIKVDGRKSRAVIYK